MRNILYKIKPLTEQQILISLDRLTRFKHPETKYLRVFKDILTSNLITPKFKKTELDEMDYEVLKNHAEKVINYSIEQLGLKLTNDCLVNQRLFDYENATFKIDLKTQKLLQNKIDYKACLNLIKENAPLNLLWIKKMQTSKNLIEDRIKYGLRFPLETVVISEGITEEILVPEFANLCGYQFDKQGVQMISAGGKNQVVKLFYQLAESLKIPIFVLLDKDAEENYNEIKPRLREFDKVHILNSGEFEDALNIELIKKTLTFGLKNISMLEPETMQPNICMVKNLEEIFRHRGMHEFKKSEFAQMIKANLTSTEDLSDEIKSIIEEISATKLKKIK